MFEVVGSPLCVASSEGEKVHERIAEALIEGQRINLTFRNVASVTSAFLNAAIGQLYGEFSEDKIKTALQVSEASQDDLVLLKRVVETAKYYFHNPAEHAKTFDSVLGDDSNVD